EPSGSGRRARGAAGGRGIREFRAPVPSDDAFLSTFAKGRGSSGYRLALRTITDAHPFWHGECGSGIMQAVRDGTTKRRLRPSTAGRVVGRRTRTRDSIRAPRRGSLIGSLRRGACKAPGEAE